MNYLVNILRNDVLLKERVEICLKWHLQRGLVFEENDYRYREEYRNPKYEILCMLMRKLDLLLYQVFHSESAEKNLEVKNMLMQELSGYLEYKMKVYYQYALLFAIGY